MLASKIKSTHFDFNKLAKAMWIVLIPLIILNLWWSIPSIYVSSVFADYSAIQNRDNIDYIRSKNIIGPNAYKYLKAVAVDKKNLF